MAELLRVEALRAGYGEAVVIEALDLALDDGRSLAVLGRNGAGKTTLINALIGAVDGERPHRARRRRHRRACPRTAARAPGSAGARRSATSSAR